MSRRTSGKPRLAPMGRHAATTVQPVVASTLSPVQRLLPHLPLVVILVLSAILATAFAWTTPRGANPDEGPHLQYVKVIATEFRLPSLDLEHRKAVGHADGEYEAHQPPLYYLLAAPFYLAGAALHPDDGPTRACRMLTVLIGLCGTSLVWLLAKQLAPNRPGLRIAATGFAAFLPMRLAVTSAVNNDALAEAMGTLALLLMVRGVMGHWRKRDWLLLGVTLGLALLSKQSCILLLPAALIAVLLSSKGGEREGTTPADETTLLLRSGGTVLAVVLLIAGWFFVRNHLLYGDPMAKKAFDAYFADAPTWESFRAGGFTYQKYLGERVLPTAMLSFWGWFGYMNPDQAHLALGAYGNGPPIRWGYPPRSWLMPILNNVLLFALAGALVYLVRRKLRKKPVNAGDDAGAGVGVGLLAIHAVFVFGAFLSFNTTYFQAQGRYLFPAIGAISLAVGAGLLEWVRAAALIRAPLEPGAAGRRERRWEAAVGCGIAAAVLALAAYAYFGVLTPGFSHS